MQSAAYFRERADTCLQLSQLMSDPHARDELRWRAREYLLEAQKLDRRGEDDRPLGPSAYPGKVATGFL